MVQIILPSWHLDLEVYLPDRQVQTSHAGRRTYQHP